MTSKIILIICTLSIIFYSWYNDEVAEKTPYVAAHTIPCQVDMTHQDCMQIKWEKNQKDWDSFVGNVDTGRENIKMYQTFVTDYHKRDLDREYVKEIKSFNIEDIVKMHIDFVYDTTKSTIATVE